MAFCQTWGYAAVGLLASTLVFIHILYQLLLHPLAKYPGPLLAKLSMIHATYHAWKGDSHIHIWQLHQKYGPAIRYGPNWLLFNSVEGYREIYGMKRNTGKHHRFSQFNPRASNLFTIHNKSEHSRRRRCIGKAFSDASVERFQGKMIDHIHHLCSQIGASQKERGGEWSYPLNMSDWMGWLVFDNLTDFLLSQQYDLLSSTKDRHIIQHIKEHMIRPAVCSYMPPMAIFKLDKLLFRGATRSTKVFWRWVKQAIAVRDVRHERCSESRDVFMHIKLSRMLETCSTLGVQSETGMFIVAGLDTTTTALCAVLFYLSRNQHVYNRLCREIRNTFETEGQIRLGQLLTSCVFLRACIDEALRMSPPVGSPPWREVGLGGELIAGEVVPQGCSVGTGIYSMHHSEAYFGSPHDFIPDRWLSDDQSGHGVVHNQAFMPFSTGPRSCIGRSLAYAEISLTVAILLWRYDFRSSPVREHFHGQNAAKGKLRAGRANPGEFQLVDRVIGLCEGPLLEFRLRNEPASQHHTK